MYFPSVCGSWVFHLYPVPLAEEQSKLAVKAVSYTVLWLDKRHHPVTPAAGFWQWIDAVKLILIFMQEVKCIRCDWLMTLQTISRWPSEALELCFRKALTNLTKDDSSWALQLLGCTKLGYENISSWDFGFTYCDPSPVIPQRPNWANSSLQVMVTTSHESRAAWMHCQWAQWAKPLQPCLQKDGTNLIKALCRARGTAVRAVYDPNFDLRK